MRVDTRWRHRSAVAGGGRFPRDHPHHQSRQYAECEGGFFPGIGAGGWNVVMFAEVCSHVCGRNVVTFAVHVVMFAEVM